MRPSWMALTIAMAFACSVYASANMGTPLGVFGGQQDIGKDSKAGTAFFDAGLNIYRVTASGANRSAMNDCLHFIYTKITGDVTFSADVRLEGNGAGSAMLMVRQSLEPDSAFADVKLQGDGLTALEYRPSAGVITSEFRAAMKSPSHLSITRHGHEFTIHAGNSGEESVMTGPIVVAMQDPVYLGLGISSQSASVVETAVFSHVRLLKGRSK